MNVATLSLLTTRKRRSSRAAPPAAAGGIEVEEYLAVMLAGFVGFQRDADRKTPGRAVGEVESSVVLGAFDQRARHEAVGQMGVAVGAESVAGVQIAVGGAVDGIGLFLVVEADDIFSSQEVAVANLDPAVHRAGPSQ